MDAIESSLLDQFLRSLTEATGFKVENIVRDVFKGHDYRHTGIDALVQLRALDRNSPIELAVEIRNSELYPRDVALSILRLRQFKEQFPQDVEVCVIADKLSPSSRQNLREGGVNYFDSSESLYFKVLPWFIHFERPAKRSEHKKPLTLFAGAREQVVHALLHHHHENGLSEFISGVDLARLSQTSGYTVTQTMRELERYEFVETEGSGPYQQRRAKRPGKLLEMWAEERSKRRPVMSLWYLSTPNTPLLSHLLQKLDDQSLDGVLITGAAAANVTTPTLTTVPTIDLIVPIGATLNLQNILGMRAVVRGHNVQVVERDGAAQLFPVQDPWTGRYHFASPFIQYLDLLNGAGRNQELADAFRKDTLRI